MNSKLLRPVGIALAVLATAAGVAFATQGGAPSAPPPVHLLPASVHHASSRSAGNHGQGDPRGRRGHGNTHGSNGLIGPAGPVGPPGPVGPAGPTGPVGPAGPAGPAGLAGPTGATGAKGPAGADGAPGAPGAQGPAGQAGPQGTAGPRGAEGPVGQPGPTGAKGDPGDTGPAGPRGAAGTPGATGPAGPAGPTGAKGDAGAALASLEQLSGLACQGTGTVHLEYDASGKATLTCTSGGTGGAGSGSGTGGSGTGGTEAPTVRINEVQTGTSASASDEFVELVNEGTVSADVTGWKVVYRSAAGTSDTTLATVPSGTTLAPGGFYLLGGAAYDGVVSADQSFSAGLAATGGAVGLRDATGALVDGAGWGTATNALVEGSPAPAPPATAAPGSSIERLPDGHDTNANSADFTITSGATPGVSNR